MQPTLRPPVPADYVTLTSWIPDATACVRWAGPNLRFPFAARELPQLLHFAHGASHSMVAPDDSLLGFGQFWSRGENTVHLGRIIVSPRQRSQGLGRVLLNLLLAEAMRTVRPETITLRVYRDNLAALSLYSSLGFTTVEAESNDDTFAMEMKPIAR